MARSYIYSNCLGSFLLDEKLSITDRRLFSEETYQERCQKLEAGDWTAEEEQLAANIAQERFFLGWKKEKKGFVLTQDINKLEAVSRLFYAQMPEMRVRTSAMARDKLKLCRIDDFIIIQVSNGLEDLNKSINLLAKRVREWYDIYNPEFSRSIDDHEKFLAQIFSPRPELLGSIGLKENQTVGADLSQADIDQIFSLAREITKLMQVRADQEKYLEQLMAKTCPNINAIAGSLIGAKLLSISGSLERMSSMPASKIQLLGAEKALFRHLRNKNAKSPKYGVLFAHQFIQLAAKGDRGKIARTLADKISIGAKVDYFKGEFIGTALRQDIERRLK